MLFSIYILFRHHMLLVLPMALSTFFILLYSAEKIEAHMKARREHSKPRWQQRGYRHRSG